MKRLIDIFRRPQTPEAAPPQQRPELPAAAAAAINRETLTNFYNGLYIALPDEWTEQTAIEHYCFLLYAFRAMPEIGPAGVEQIREARRDLFTLLSDGKGGLLPDEQIDRAKVVQWLLGHEQELATVYNGLKTPWAELRDKAGFGESGYTLYRPAGEPVWHHMQDNEQHAHMYRTGIATFLDIYEKIPALRRAIETTPPRYELR